MLGLSEAKTYTSTGRVLQLLPKLPRIDLVGQGLDGGNGVKHQEKAGVHLEEMR